MTARLVQDSAALVPSTFLLRPYILCAIPFHCILRGTWVPVDYGPRLSPSSFVFYRSLLCACIRSFRLPRLWRWLLCRSRTEVWCCPAVRCSMIKRKGLMFYNAHLRLQLLLLAITSEDTGGIHQRSAYKWSVSWYSKCFISLKILFACSHEAQVILFVIRWY